MDLISGRFGLFLLVLCRFGSVRFILGQFLCYFVWFRLFWLGSVWASLHLILGRKGLFWTLLRRFESVWISFWDVLACLGSFYVILDQFGSFWVSFCVILSFFGLFRLVLARCMVKYRQLENDNFLLETLLLSQEF